MFTRAFVVAGLCVGCANGLVSPIDASNRLDVRADVAADSQPDVSDAAFAPETAQDSSGGADASRDLGLETSTPSDSSTDVQTSCPSGQTLCGTSCVNIAADPRNCGSCGRSCVGVLRECIDSRCDCTNC